MPKTHVVKNNTKQTRRFLEPSGSGVMIQPGQSAEVDMTLYRASEAFRQALADGRFEVEDVRDTATEKTKPSGKQGGTETKAEKAAREKAEKDAADQAAKEAKEKADKEAADAEAAKQQGQGAAKDGAASAGDSAAK